MEKFTSIRSIAVPWLMPNIDTDTITPMRRLLLNIKDMENYSFEPYRFVNGDGDKGILNMDFPLNQAAYKDAQIMVVGENFGCGSSRETAPEAIARLGIRCLIGSSFGGIFTKNCYQQGILPVCFPKETIDILAAQAENGGEFFVDLLSQTVTSPDQNVFHFSCDSIRREMLLEGVSDVDVTLKSREQIDRFFSEDRKNRPWLYSNHQ